MPRVPSSAGSLAPAPHGSRRGRAVLGHVAALGLALAVAAAAAAALPGALTLQAQLACPDNLLVNGGFEGGFGGRGRLAETVGLGWSAWYERFPGRDGINYVPDFEPARGLPGSPLAAEGMWSQQMATRDATHTAGLWQRVAVPPGSVVSARVLVYGWASNADDPARSEPPGTYVSLLGLDAGGGVDPNAASVTWTAPVSVTDSWVPLSLELPVHGDAATLFLRGQPLLPLRHNVSRWDAACVRVLGSVDEPLPTATRPPAARGVLPGTPTAVPTASATADDATRSALDVGLFVDAASTSAAAAAVAAAPATPAPPGLPGAPGLAGAPEAAPAVEPGVFRPEWGDAAADPWSGDVPVPRRAELVRAALADRAGMLFLGLAALFGGLLLGARRVRSRTDGGEA